MLKKIRVGLALVVFVFITLYFLDFTGLLPDWFNFLTRIQFVPALLSLSVITVLVLVISTLIFGRVYCSVICPLGVFQDVTGRVAAFSRKKKLRYKFRRARTFLRWSIVVVALAGFLLGVPVLLALTDPYSAYGRIVVSVFKPVYVLGNNLLEFIFTHFDNYTFYRADVSIQGWGAFVVAFITLLVVVYLAWRHGRTYCNTFCPVGTVLGFLSKYSLLKIRIDHSACNSCSLCETNCKGFCINSKEQSIDYSRCVACFNCIESCNKGAISFSYGLAKRKKQTEVDESKRKFLTTAVLSTAALPAVFAGNAKSDKAKPIPMAPPGAISTQHLLDHCTACHLCVSKCPTHVIKPAFMEYGLAGMMFPVMKFSDGFCNYDCTVCSEVCPNGAIKPLTVDQKHLTQVGKVVLNLDHCIAYRDETNCGACAEHCPTQAVTMVPYKGALTIPKTDQSICVGCGGCEYICPETGKAIYIEGNPVHLEAEMFEEAETKEFDFGGFGF